MSYADTLPDSARKRARLFAYASAWAGCISEVMMDSSAIIILLFTMLKASSMVTMLSTGFTGVMAFLLMIPCAWVTDKIGLKRSVKYACIAGCIGFLMIASSPFLTGNAAIICAMTGAVIFAAQRSLYSASWYPLLDNFLRTEERGRFFSMLRTGYMIFTGTLFFLIGLLLGKEPPFWLMQVVIGIAGFAILLRWFFISRFPVDPEYQAGTYDFRKSVSISMHNALLTGYSVYICILSIGNTILIPLTLVYLRKYVKMEPGTVQILSSVGMGGSILGYFLYRYLTRMFRLKWLELTVHCMFILLALTLFLLRTDLPHLPLIMGGIIFIVSICNAWLMCNNSMEYMALARPGNKSMALAFCQSYQCFGVTVGRFSSSILLGISLLAPVWTFGGRTYCIYQSIFLLSAAVMTIALVMLPILPAFIQKHEDYYNSADR